jgi:excisionase family DNA binding protein
MPTTQAEFLRPSEIAKQLACAVEMIHDAIHSGALPATNIGRGKKRPTWRIRCADYQAWLESRTTRPKKQDPPQPRPKRYAAPDHVKKIY